MPFTCRRRSRHMIMATKVTNVKAEATLMAMMDMYDSGTSDHHVRAAAVAWCSEEDVNKEDNEQLWLGCVQCDLLGRVELKEECISTLI